MARVFEIFSSKPMPRTIFSSLSLRLLLRKIGEQDKEKDTFAK
jgi:hypothetical protein